MTPMTTIQTDKTLQVTTPSEREVVVTRVFNAPANAVFDALTTPEVVSRWQGLDVCEIDLREGGAWRFVGRNPEGLSMTVSGSYVEVRRPRRLVQTMEVAADEECTETTAFTTTDLFEDQGKTTLTTTIVYPSREMRDEAIESGLERGIARRYGLLDKYLESAI